MRIWIGFLSGALVLLAFHAAFHAMPHGGSLGLGSVDVPTPLYARFLALWTFFGAAAALAVAVALGRVLGADEVVRGLRTAWNRGSDRKWILYGSSFALLVPALLRQYVLLGVPVADDESAYRFMAEVLAAGRLYVESPPAKLFFDNRFLINDGKLYAQYFVGWPALAAPGVWLGVAGFMNALYSALALPPIFLTVRRLAGSAWARASVVVYLASPMLMVGAATELAHTSCFAALAWLAWLCLAAEGSPRRYPLHAAAALAFSVAFFIRPVSALGVGLPWLAGWLAGLGSLAPAERRRAIAAFALPAVVMAALFLTVNQVQNGSPVKLGYDRYYEYAEANGFRFSLWTEPAPRTVRNFDFSDLTGALAGTGVALFRFNFALFGWPSSLLFAFFARGDSARRFWWSAFLFVAAHFFVGSAGIDAFAPVHYFELALPVLVLTVLGARSLDGFIGRAAAEGLGGGLRYFAPSLLAALVAVALAGYVPVRLQEAHRLASAVRMPQQALEEAGIERAVVFASSPFISNCRSWPSAPMVFTRPDNDPFLENDVLWVNHVSLEEDRALMERFPDRTGYVMGWLESCEVVMSPLAVLPPGSVPPARIPGG